MLKRMIDAHLAGQSAPKIAEWMNPAVSVSGIQRYIRLYVKPVLKNADEMAKWSTSRKEENNTLTENNVTEKVADALSVVNREMAKTTIIGAQVLTARDSRIAVEQDLARRMAQVIEERGFEYATKCEHCTRGRSEHPVTKPDGSIACHAFVEIPGGASGLLVRKFKPNGTEYAFDSGLTAELREQMKMIAMESGQWQETTGGNVSIQIVCPTAGADGKMEEVKVRFSTEGAIDALDGTVEEIGLKQLG